MTTRKIRSGDSYNYQDSIIVTGKKISLYDSGTQKNFAQQAPVEMPHLAFASGVTLTDRDYTKNGIITYQENGGTVKSKFYKDRSNA